jgi:hypothetical protein
MFFEVRITHVPRLQSESKGYGEVLDECGNYICYGETFDSPEMRDERGFQEGFVEGCKVKRNIAKDAFIVHDDVELSPEEMRTPCVQSGTSTAAKWPPPRHCQRKLSSIWFVLLR